MEELNQEPGAFGQEPRASGQEPSVKSQEPSEEDTIYDISDNNDTSDNANTDGVENNDNATDADKELQRMVAEMGAETLLGIIKDNRNAAIRQIISEVEAAQSNIVNSGASTAPTCASIFDLAAMA